MESPQNHIWGPALWMILHSSTERIGFVVLHKLPEEEKRIWSSLLSSLRFSIPCPACKMHYTTYFSKYPIYSFTREGLREWLFNLHNDVNNRIGSNNEFTLDKVAEHYSRDFHYTHCYKTVESQMNLSLRLQWTKREDIQKTCRLLLEMQRFYSLI
jgi:hypothetical protein